MLNKMSKNYLLKKLLQAIFHKPKQLLKDIFGKKRVSSNLNLKWKNKNIIKLKKLWVKDLQKNTKLFEGIIHN